MGVTPAAETAAEFTEFCSVYVSLKFCYPEGCFLPIFPEHAVYRVKSLVQVLYVLLLGNLGFWCKVLVLL